MTKPTEISPYSDATHRDAVLMTVNALIDQARTAHPQLPQSRMRFRWHLLSCGGIVERQSYQDLLDQISDGVGRNRVTTDSGELTSEAGRPILGGAVPRETPVQP
jgi:hypothetical protein